LHTSLETEQKIKNLTNKKYKFIIKQIKNYHTTFIGIRIAELVFTMGWQTTCVCFCPKQHKTCMSIPMHISQHMTCLYVFCNTTMPRKQELLKLKITRQNFIRFDTPPRRKITILTIKLL
jgi:hypothetical protein